MSDDFDPTAGVIVYDNYTTMTKLPILDFNSTTGSLIFNNPIVPSVGITGASVGSTLIFSQSVQFQNYVNSFGLVHFEREDRNLFRQGLKLIQDALNVEQKERIPFIVEEIIPVLQEYLLSYNEVGQIKVFNRRIAATGIQSFRKNPIASVMGLHGQIVFLDSLNQTIVKSFDRTGKTLKELLKNYNHSVGYDRFIV